MRKFVVPFALAALLLVLLGTALIQPVPSAQAAVPGPLLAPTPVSIQPVAPSKIVFPMFSGVITQSQRVGPFNFKNMRIADIQYVVDVSDTQTLTARLDYSNDNVHWVSGATILNAVAVDTNDMQEFYTFGGAGSITVTLGTANPVTLTLYAAGQ